MQWLAAGLLLLQFVCIAYSLGVVNYGNTPFILITIIVCGLNVSLTADIALLLSPSLSSLLGRPLRPEYGFAILSLGILIYFIVTKEFFVTEKMFFPTNSIF